MRASILAQGLLGLTLAGVLAGEPAAAVCPIVDRGSPTDRVTTVSLVVLPAPCTQGSVWTGWYCALLQSDANDNGISYQIDVRWNRNGQPSNGTVTWLQAAGRVYHRENTTYAAGVQDELDTLDGVRSIELAGIGEAFLTPPRNGFPNISAVYADVLEFLRARRLLEGVACHFGNSAGSMVGANALAYHELDQLLDGVVFGGGPYWANLELTCLDPNWATASLRDDVDQWNWLEFNGTTPCVAFDPAPDPTYACRGTLGADADTDYVGVRVAVIIGQQDPFLPWIDNEAADYLQSITAESKSFDRPANVGHTIMNFAGGASTALQRIREIMTAPSALATELPPAPSGRRFETSPNPFLASTRIEFSTERAGLVSLTVHDSAGRRVAMLVNGERPAGQYSFEWDGRDDEGGRVRAGVYFLRLEAGDVQETRKVVRIR